MVADTAAEEGVGTRGGGEGLRFKEAMRLVNRWAPNRRYTFREKTLRTFEDHSFFKNDPEFTLGMAEPDHRSSKRTGSYEVLPNPLQRRSGKHSVYHYDILKCLVRNMMAGHDLAGVARALATLHRFQRNMDPDVYRFTVALLRRHGDHKATVKYFRKIFGIKRRAFHLADVDEAWVIAYDYIGYLVDKQLYKEALKLLKTVYEGRYRDKARPQFSMISAMLRIAVALVEKTRAVQGLDKDTAGSNNGSDDMQKEYIADKEDKDGEGGEGRNGVEEEDEEEEEEKGEEEEEDQGGDKETGTRIVIPDLHDPIPLVAPLRECLRGGDGGHRRARLHALEALHCLKAAHRKFKGKDASAVVYLAVLLAANGETSGALKHLQDYLSSCPVNSGAPKAWATLVGLLSLKRERGEGDGVVVEEDPTLSRCRADALWGWLRADPLEPKAALGLFDMLRSGGASAGVVEEERLVAVLASQLEAYGSPGRCCRGVTRAAGTDAFPASKLWAAMAGLLGPLRTRDVATPLAAQPASRGPQEHGDWSA
ncbi:unnamed protein product, partial [Discosporangium mesarthrocarpum]